MFVIDGIQREPASVNSFARFRSVYHLGINLLIYGGKINIHLKMPNLGRISYLSSLSVSQEAPSENTRSGIREPAGELDTKSGSSSRTIILTVFGSKDSTLLPTSAALYKVKIKRRQKLSTGIKFDLGIDQILNHQIKDHGSIFNNYSTSARWI